MARNDPSPEQIANLEKEQREAELQAEFDEFERQERARKEREQAYDNERMQIEQKYAKQNNSKSYTGVRVIDQYLDKSDVAAETAASRRRISIEKEVKKLEQQGKITPEYAAYLRKEAAGTYEKQKKSTVRIAVESGINAGKSVVSGASNYLDNAPMRKAPARAPRKYGKAPKRSTGSFSSGISMGGVATPAMGQPMFQPFSAPTFAVPKGKSDNAPRKPIGELGFPKTFGGSVPRTGNPRSGLPTSVIPKNSGSRFTDLTSPFGSRKTNPVKGRKKTKGLW